MSTDARNALRTIRRCLADGRYRLTRHFWVRLAERGAFWADVAAVIDAPASAKADGLDEAGRSRWIVSGKAADGAAMGLVCAIGRDDAGEMTVFVTGFWQD